ncbi:MAG: alpha/beta hydrolase [Eubacteriales bacterium]|nr:alpha/beta hydrolase [Eubacteriales bacterium]
MKTKKYVLLLALSLVLIFVGSYFANTYHTSFGETTTERIYFDTERGTLSGILYMPKNASETNPVPCVIVTHGYLNSAEMQDANAIELSRRGYVVLALDMYDHGHSKAVGDYTGSFMHFWPTSLWDAAQYMYEKPYVLKDENGNGLIGVTGHSMGGFSSSMAVYYDEQAFKESGIRKIYASVSMGSDFSSTAYVGVTAKEAIDNSGGRVLGKIAGQFDEFFFNSKDQAPKHVVVKKNYVGTEEGKMFLEQEDPKPETWYDTKDGGKRIIYQPYEIHPWNHFSKTSTSNVVDFYTEAFAPFNSNLNQIESKNQIWLYKEIFECIALIGFFLLFVPLIRLLVSLPFFNKAVSTVPTPAANVVKPVGEKMNSLFIAMFSILLPAITFPTIMDKNFNSYGMITLTVVGAIFTIVALYGLLRSKQKGEKVASGIVFIAGLALVVFTRFPSFVQSPVFSAPTSNQIAYWAIICTVFTLLFLSMNFLSKGSKLGLTASSYGVALSVGGVFASLIVVILAIAIGYGLLFLIDSIWLVDFRIWTFAIKTFDGYIIGKTLPYLIPFFIYYFVLSASIFVNTNKESMKGFKGYLYAMLMAAGGITIYLIFHYGLLVNTGTALYPTQSLSSILLMALVPTLCIAASYTRYFYKQHGNIWIPAFLNALLMTLMTVANTCVYYR